MKPFEYEHTNKEKFIENDLWRGIKYQRLNSKRINRNHFSWNYGFVVIGYRNIK